VTALERRYLMNRTRTTAITLAAALGVGLGGYGIAAAQDSDPSPQPDPSTEIDAPEGVDDEAIDPARVIEVVVTAEDARAVAVDAAGGGTASDAVLGDENGTLVFEVDVVDAAGSSVEVNVDAITGDPTVETDDEAIENEDEDEAEADDDDVQHENEHDGADDPDEGHEG
jgi:uncharacterized membrane protein YkoI